MKKRLVFFVLMQFVFVTTVIAVQEVKPKYGPSGAPRATLLSQSHEYFQTHTAQKFWDLNSHYVGQYNEAACSVASLAMVLNAARTHIPKVDGEHLVLQEELFDKVKTEHWKDRLSKKGWKGKHEFTLGIYGRIVEEAFKKYYGFPKATVQVVHVNDTTQATKDLVEKALIENENNLKEYFIGNFNHYTVAVGDESVNDGHLCPIGAYDAAKKQVLIFDVYRYEYEPYWVSLDTFVAGMNTFDKDAKMNRGFLVVKTE